MWVVRPRLDSLRGSTIVLGISNAAVLILGASLLVIDFKSCGHHGALPFAAVTLASAVRLTAMFNTALAQEATARNILESPESSVIDTVVRHERRVIRGTLSHYPLDHLLFFLGISCLFFCHSGLFERIVDFESCLVFCFLDSVILIAASFCFTVSMVVRVSMFWSVE